MENIEESCNHFEDLLQASMDNGGCQPVPLELQLHLEKCHACRNAQTEYEALDILAREFISLEAPSDILPGIMGTLAHEKEDLSMATPLSLLLTALKKSAPLYGLAAAMVILTISLYWPSTRDLYPWSTVTVYLNDYLTDTLGGIIAILNGLSSYWNLCLINLMTEMSGIEKYSAPAKGPAGLAGYYALAVVACMVWINYGLISQTKQGGQSSWGT
jgi:hypothetical protein